MLSSEIKDNIKMREISLDTETTGFKFEEGHRLVEIGCVELYNMIPTGNTFHVYINPERDVPIEAYRVHGLGSEFLSKKLKFSQIADDFLEFIGDDPLVIHNAPFDMGFLNAELKRAGKQEISNKVIDTLTLARKKLPNKQHNLDNLCKIYKVDNSGRDLHGALIDADLLASVYLELQGGANYKLSLEQEDAKPKTKKISLTAYRKKAPVPKNTGDQDKPNIDAEPKNFTYEKLTEEDKARVFKAP